MEIFSVVYEHLCNTIIVSYIFQYLFYFEMKEKKKRTIYLILYGIAFSMIRIIFRNVSFISFATALLTAIIPALLAKERFFKKLILSFFLTFMMVGNINALILNTITTLLNILTISAVEPIVAVFSITINLILWLSICHTLHNRYIDKNHRMQTKFAIFLSILCFFDMGFYFMTVDSISIEDYGIIFEWVIFFFGIFLLFTIFYLIFLYFEKTHYNIVTDFTKEYMSIQKEHFHELQEKDVATRRFRHDIKNHLIILENYAEKKDIEKIQIYLKQILNDFSETQSKYHTGNLVVDGLLQQYQPQLEASQIELEFDGQITENCFIDDFDLCTIFSNAIKNAIEACEQLPSAFDRWIKIKIEFKPTELILQFVNPVKENVAIKHNHIKTSKSDSLNHGIGLRQIEKTVNDYSGTMLLKSENNTFKLMVRLVNKEAFQ